MPTEPLGDLASSVRLLWEPPERPSRGPKPALSIERITQTAVDVADADGLAAVSMQRVAGELDFTKMAMYRYVPGKAELVALMVDKAMGPPPSLDDIPGGWRPKLAEWARQTWLTFGRHPWLLEVTIGPRVFGRNLGWMDRALSALHDSGLNGGERLDILLVVTGHVRTVTQQTVPGSTTEAQMNAAIAEVLSRHGARYPALLAAVISGEGQDNGLEFGLQRIFDGVERLIAQRP